MANPFKISIPLVLFRTVVLIFQLADRVSLEYQLSEMLQLPLLSRDAIQISPNLEQIPFKRKIG